MQLVSKVQQVPVLPAESPAAGSLSKQLIGVEPELCGDCSRFLTVSLPSADSPAAGLQCTTPLMGMGAVAIG